MGVGLLLAGMEQVALRFVNRLYCRKVGAGCAGRECAHTNRFSSGHDRLFCIRRGVKFGRAGTTGAKRLYICAH